MTLIEEFGLGELDPAGETTPIAMRDGTVLHGDLYRAHAAGPCPAVVIRLPYGTSRGYTYMPQVARYLAGRGFHVLVQDVRGRFRSEGDATPLVHEAQDGYATIDWVAAQPWCSGSVGMIGTSYYGFTQWAAASSGHPALKAIVPRYTAQLIPPSESFARGDILPAPDAIEWIVGIWSTGTMIETADLGLDFLTGPLRESVPETLQNARRILHERLADGEERFAARVYPEGLPAPRLRIPALHVAGWWDNCKPFQMADWADASGRAPAAEHQFLVVAGTDHRDLRFSLTGEAQDDHLHGDDEALERYLPRMLELPISFLDHYLRDHQGPWQAPRVRYELVNVGWRTAPAWPPANAARSVLHLQLGQLVEDPVSLQQTIRWVHDPMAPVPSLTQNDFERLAVIPDETSIHGRYDVITFTGEELREPLDLAGQAEVAVTISAEAASTDVIATLCDIDPSGRGWDIAEGAVRVDTSDGPARTRIRLGDVAYRLLPGHRLRLAICSSRFPRYAVHPGTAEDAWDAVERCRVEQALHLGGPDGGTLTLPLAPAEAVA